MNEVIKTSRLTKSYQGNTIVSQVSMNVRKGEIYGFLGPNGAGKSTILKMLAKLITPDEGEIRLFGEILGRKSSDILKRISYIIESPVFYDKLSAKENLNIHCRYMGYYDVRSIDQVLTSVNLSPINPSPVKNFSLGMKQRLGIARAIVTKPELLILDEPINGLDPMGVKEMRELFKNLSKEHGTTILVSSHILSEIEQIADTIGIISKGRLLKEIQMDKVKKLQLQYVEFKVHDAPKAVHVLEEELQIKNYKVMEEDRIRVYEQEKTPNVISQALFSNQIGIESIQIQNGSLEEYFLKLMNGGALYAEPHQLGNQKI